MTRARPFLGALALGAMVFERKPLEYTTLAELVNRI